MTTTSFHVPKYEGDYLDEIMANHRGRIESAVRILKEYDFDAVAFRGMSGALVGPCIAMLMNKSMIMVRKHADCHSDICVEGDKAARHYVIADDFQSTGRTARTIVREVLNFAPEAHCIGVIELRDVLSGITPIRRAGEHSIDYDHCVNTGLDFLYVKKKEPEKPVYKAEILYSADKLRAADLRTEYPAELMLAPAELDPQGSTA
jgi:hypothetical protein